MGTPSAIIPESCPSCSGARITTVCADTDVLPWLKRQGKGYQTRINAIVRKAMLRNLRHKAVAAAMAAMAELPSVKSRHERLV